jgi:phage terminase small subunit
MGKRGPARQPTSLKVARGNPGKRPLNQDEPEFEPPAALDPPADLKGAGLVEWRGQADRLVQAGVLTAADMSGFTSYCRLLTEEEIVQKLVAEDPKAKDLHMRNYLIKVRAQANQYRAQYGLTPSSRSGVKAKKPKDQADERRKKFGLIGGSTPNPV